MKLELKYITPYLPYGLHIKHDEGACLIICGAFKKHTRDDYFTYSLLNWDKDIKSDEAKPILRPMSDFWDTSKSWMQQVLDIDNSIEFWSGEFDNPCNLPYVCFEVLIRNHFDVFDLLSQNLAISIHDLEK